METLFFDDDGTIRTNPAWIKSRALYAKGVEMTELGDLATAREKFRSAIKHDPKFVDARYNLAVVYYALGDNQAAESEYRVILKTRPNDIDALNNLAAIHFKRRELKKAKPLLERALAIDENVALTHKNLTYLYQELDDDARKLNHTLKARQLVPNIFEEEPSPPHHEDDLL